MQFYIPHHKQRELASFFSTFLGSYQPYKNQQEYVYRCPQCGKLKFSINFGKGKAHCWVCPDYAFGNLLKLLREHFPEREEEYRAILREEGYYLEPAPEEAQAPEEPAQPLLLPESAFAMCAKDQEMMAMRPFWNYLRARGVDPLVAQEHGVHACFGGPYRNRILFLSFDAHSKLNYFLGRAIHPETEPTYFNAKAKKTEVIWDASRIGWNKPLIILEGIFDLMAVEQVLRNDYDYTLLLGKSLSEESLLWSQILDNKVPVVLALDPDAGRSTQQVAQKLVKWGIEVSVAQPPIGMKDFGECMLAPHYEGIVREAFNRRRTAHELMLV